MLSKRSAELQRRKCALTTQLEDDHDSYDNLDIKKLEAVMDEAFTPDYSGEMPM